LLDLLTLKSDHTILFYKAKFKEVTGKDHGKPQKEKKEKQPAQQEASEKNKEKRAAKAAAKAKKEAEKAAKRAERERREREKAERLAGVGQDNFGDAKMIQSQVVTDKKWVEVNNLKPALAGQKVLVRGYVQISRSVGKAVFVLLRSTLYTVQGVAFQNNKDISQGMIKYIAGLPVESVVDMEGTVTVPNDPVESATQKMVEIQITSFHCVSKAKKALPFLMEDACRPDAEKETDVGEYNEDEQVQAEDGLVRIGLKNRLDNRWLDLRTPANQSIMRIESMVGLLFRECLTDKGFIELHSPKLIAGSSEGGADVFTLDYFGQPCCLAMSPQLHKQMAAACSGFERVFTTGPVFRAENSNTRRHLCEFTGFDLEMAIHEHYDEVMDVFSDLFIHIFDGINERCKAEVERVREQHPFEDLKYLRPTLKLTYAEGCALLREAGIDQVNKKMNGSWNNIFSSFY
jgi:aspartyl-tRNA synthetase